MHLEEYTLKVVVMSPEDWENMPDDQRERVKNLERKIKQYNAMLKTFVTKYTGKKVNHTTIEDHLENNK